MNLSWIKKKIFKFFFFFIYLVLLFAIAEIAVSKFYPNIIQLDSVVIPTDEKVFKNFKPNAYAVRRPGVYDTFQPVVNKYNSLGIRGPEIGIKKQYRVLNLGDSFIQADEVDFNRTFTIRLDKFFANIEFLSHGVPSWAPTPQFSWLYHFYDKLRFDEVNLFVCINDFYRRDIYTGSNLYYKLYAEYEDNIPISYSENNLIKNLSIYEKIKKIIQDTLFNYEIPKIVYYVWKLNFSIETDLINNEIIFLNSPVGNWPSSLKYSVDSTITEIVNMNKYLVRNKIKLNVLMVPLAYSWKNENVHGKYLLKWKKNFEISQDGLENYLSQQLKINNINYIDLRKPFNLSKNENPKKLLFNITDGHWNENGHDVVYTVLKKYYKEKK